MIQVLQRAHILLESIAEVPEKIWSIKELAALIHVSAPTCCNIVETLVQLDLIQCLGKRKGYCAGTNNFYIIPEPLCLLFQQPRHVHRPQRGICVGFYRQLVE